MIRGCELVGGGPGGGGDLMGQQALSLHLKVLRDAGLVAVRPHGQRRLCAVRPEGLAALRDFLAEFWPEHLQRLKQAVESGDQAAGPGDGG